MKHRIYAVFCLALLAAGCGKRVEVDLPPPTFARVGTVERGIASWYGHPYHGRTTSNGETYDMHALTAAHLSLPFDTVVRVTNLSNGRTADLRINDRGPFRKGRLIDVSRAAAEQLGMIALGTAEVEVLVLAAPGAAATNAGREPCVESGIGVQVGSFRDVEKAERVLEQISGRYDDARIVAVETAQGTLHRVIVAAPDSASAELARSRLAREGFNGFVTRTSADSSCFARNPS